MCVWFPSVLRYLTFATSDWRLPEWAASVRLPGGGNIAKQRQCNYCAFCRSMSCSMSSYKFVMPFGCVVFTFAVSFARLLHAPSTCAYLQLKSMQSKVQRRQINSYRHWLLKTTGPLPEAAQGISTCSPLGIARLVLLHVTLSAAIPTAESDVSSKSSRLFHMLAGQRYALLSLCHPSTGSGLGCCDGHDGKLVRKSSSLPFDSLHSFSTLARFCLQHSYQLSPFPCTQP